MLDLGVEAPHDHSSQPAEQQSQLHQQPQPENRLKRQNKLRSACDTCHTSKIRCCGGTPCNACRRLQVDCVRSSSRRQGRPKGVKNKKKAGITKTQETETSPQENAETDGRDQSADDAVALDFPVHFPCDQDTFWSLDAPMDICDLTATAVATSPSVLVGANEILMDTSQDAFQTSLAAWDIDMGKPQPPQQQHQSSSTVPEHNNGACDDPSHSALETLRLSCDCLQRFAQLLSNLKTLTIDISSVQPQKTDTVLLCTRNASDAWKQMLKCRLCRENNAEEVLYLSITGIRIALRNLEILFSSQYNGVASAADNDGRDVDDEGDDDEGNDEDYDGSESGSMTARFAVYSSLGSYTMDAEEQQVVAKIIALRLVREMQEILQALKQRLQARGALSSVNLHSNHSAGGLGGDMCITTTLSSSSAEGANWHMSTSFEEGLAHLQTLLESAERTSDVLLYRLRNLSASDLNRL